MNDVKKRYTKLKIDEMMASYGQVMLDQVQEIQELVDKVKRMHSVRSKVLNPTRKG